MGDFVFSKVPSSLQSTYQALSAMRLQAELTDVRLVASDGKHCTAHRVVLASSCAYFHAMFTLDLAEKSRQDKVNMRGFESDVLESIVQFCYGEEVRVVDGDIEFLVRLAVASDLIQLDELQRMCVDALVSVISPANVLSMQAFGASYSMPPILRACTRHIQRHFELVSVGEEYLRLALSDVVDIVSRDDLEVSEEECVYRAVMRWIQYDPEERIRLLPEVLVHVRLPLLPPQRLHRILEENPHLHGDLFCCGLVQEAHFYQDFPLHRSVLNDCPRSRPRQSRTVASSAPGAGAGAVLVAGGVDGSGPVDSLTRYDLVSGERAKLAPMPHTVYAMGACVLNGCLYVVGGHGDPFGVLSGVLCYGIGKGTWKQVAPMKTARRYLSVAVINGLIYAAGGQTKEGVTAATECYNPTRDEWTPCSPMRHGRMYHSAAACQHLLYVVGGHDGFVRLGSLERYDPFTESWACLSAMSVPRSVAGVAVCGGSIFVAGGYVKNRHLDTVEEYSVELDQWSISGPMDSPRSAFGLLARGRTLYAVGGFDGFFLSRVESRTLRSTSPGDDHGGDWQTVDCLELKRAHFGVVLCDI